MNKYQTHSVAGWEGWREFLETRLNQYLGGICPQTDSARRIRGATLIAPSGWHKVDLSTACISNHVFSPISSDDPRWVKRPDAFDAASHYLLDVFSTSVPARLFCLDRLARPGDPVLERQSHAIHNGLVFHCADLADSSVREVAWTLRSGRVMGLAGSICAQSVPEMCSNMTKEKFITDAFDGDMIVICDL